MIIGHKCFLVIWIQLLVYVDISNQEIRQYPFHSGHIPPSGRFDSDVYDAHHVVELKFKGKPQEVVWIDIDYFEIEAPTPSGCVIGYALLAVILDDDRQLTVSPYYCGKRTSFSFHTLQRQVLFIFKSNFSHKNYRIIGSYRFVHEDDLYELTDSLAPPSLWHSQHNPGDLGCGGIIPQATGIFSFPPHRTPAIDLLEYGGVMECFWLIDSTDRIQINITHLNLLYDNDCSKSELSVYDARFRWMLESRIRMPEEFQQNWCRNTDQYNNKQLLFNTSDKALIRLFVSDLALQKSSGESVALELSWKSVPHDHHSPPTEHMTENYENPSEAFARILRSNRICKEHEFECSSLHCISKSLVCDGYSNCPDGGDDERDCVYTAQYVRSTATNNIAVIAPTIYLVIILIIYSVRDEYL